MLHQLLPATVVEQVVGQRGNIDEDERLAEARANAEKKVMQMKLKAQKKKQAKLDAERQQALQEKAEIEEELRSVVENQEQLEQRIKKLQKKYERKLEAARAEITDLHEEFEAEREELLATIREQNREQLLWQQLAQLVYSPRELQKMMAQAAWDEQHEVWSLPRVKHRQEAGSVKLPDILGQTSRYKPMHVDRLKEGADGDAVEPTNRSRAPSPALREADMHRSRSRPHSTTERHAHSQLQRQHSVELEASGENDKPSSNVLDLSQTTPVDRASEAARTKTRSRSSKRKPKHNNVVMEVNLDVCITDLNDK